MTDQSPEGALRAMLMHCREWLQGTHKGTARIQAIDAALAAPQATTQQPVGHIDESGKVFIYEDAPTAVLLYTSPQAIRDLSDEEIDGFALRRIGNDWRHLDRDDTRAIVRECIRAATSPAPGRTWLCPRCGVDRFQAPCPQLQGCPMVGVAASSTPKGAE